VNHVSATVARLRETATVTVEVRPLADEQFVVLDLDPESRVETSFNAPETLVGGYGVAACSGIRYATRLAGRDRTVAVLSITGSNLSLDAHDAIAHAAMYAAWSALRFHYSQSEINVDPDWVLQ
tara:strand:+ start:5547 stop:5918 length:372 start_codon:yes stop_codon:yes gene_type:complete